jgi:hypothetical protein
MKPIETFRDLEALLKEEGFGVGWREPRCKLRFHYQASNTTHPWHVELRSHQETSVPLVRANGKSLGEAFTRVFEAHEEACKVIEREP